MIACSTPPVVSVERRRYRVAPPERDFYVHPGETVAIPLYDGELVSPSELPKMLRYLHTIVVPDQSCIQGAFGSASSRRVALFLVTGTPGQGETMWVHLTLAQLKERCVSCRIVHFFIHIGDGRNPK
jgi:hypothetical protein